MKEHVFGINEFKEPKVLTGNKAIESLIISLFLLEKGTHKSHPDMGIGILTRYRYCDTNQLDELKTDVYDQLGKYLPTLSVVEIDISYNSSENGLDINIGIDEGIFYIFEADFEKDKVELVDIKSII